MLTRSILKGFLITGTALLVFLLPGTRDAYAHKVNMFAYVDGTDIYLEGYFSDGHKARNSTVTVYDANETELLKGTTNEDGQFSFPIPKIADLRIVLNAGLGHQTEYVLLADELSDQGEADTTQQNEPASTVTNEQSESGSTSSRSGGVSNTELNQVVERAVGQAIKPLMRSVSEMREERSLGTIVGGIGYIFGILGIVAYLKARKERTKQITDSKQQ